MKIEDQVLSIEQAKHLQELGLDMSDAALCWVKYNNMMEQKEENMVTPINLLLHHQFVPTYTLQEVLEELPDVIYVDFKRGRNLLRHEYIDGIYSIYYDTEDGDMINLVEDDSFLNVAYQMLCWVVENGYLEDE